MYSHTEDPGQVAGGLVSGVVKSWNGSRGYGFISSPGMAGDVMFLRAVLPADCKEVRGTFLEGKNVQFDVQPGNGGKVQAANIQIMTAEGDQLAGKVKSFSEQDGMGFIETSMLPGIDVSFSSHDFDNLLPGANLQDQLVIFQADAQPDGRYVASKVLFQSVKIAKDFKLLRQSPGMKRGSSDMGDGNFGNQFGSGNDANAMAQAMIAMMNAMMGGQQDSAPKRHKNNESIAVATGQRASGLIKTYNAQKGFGFIEAPDLPSDVMFMKHDLPAEAQNEDIKGCGVSFEVMQKPDGKLCARNVTSQGEEPVSTGQQSSGYSQPSIGYSQPSSGYSQPTSGYSQPPSGYDQQTSGSGQQTSGYANGLIKSYNSAKGFGFIEAQGVPSDVMFMKRDLPAEAQNEDIKGCAVRFEVLQKPDGKLCARNITSGC